MPELLTLSRAARLVGVSRGAIQKRIKSGELPTFEGSVSVTDLLRVYPDARLEDDTALERLERIKESAFAKRIRERLLPDPEVLLVRLHELGKELAGTKARLAHYRGIVDGVQEQLAGGAEAVALRHWLTRELARTASDGSEPLLARDSVLRLVAAQVRVEPSGHEFFVEGSANLLDAALRAGLAPAYACSDASCGLCTARVVSGRIKATRVAGFTLSAAARARGDALLCCHTAVTDLVIDASEAESAADIPRQEIAAHVERLEHQGETLLLHVRTPAAQRLRFLAGQRVALELGDGHRAVQAVASCPCEDRHLEFHIQRRPADEFSTHAFERLRAGQRVTVTGPAGDFTLRADSPHSLIFLAFGAGFAPIKGLIEHAMALDAAETVHLYWVAPNAGAHYLDNLCRAWADALDNFRYTPLVGTPDAALARIAQDFPDLGEHDVYTAGPQAALALAQQRLRDLGLPEQQLRMEPV